MADLQAKRIMDELNDLVSDTCIEIAINLNRQLEEDTPKKTGLASKNWIASKAAASGAAVYPKAAAAAAQAAGLDSVRRTFDAKRDKQIIIENNVPYISGLNDGSSRKAPAGFVQGAIARAVAALRGRPRARRGRGNKS